MVTLKKPRKYLLYQLLLFACMLSQLSYGQDRLVLNYTVDNGLASNNVYYIIQDRRGFIWLATDNGVSRFDGKKFLNFNSSKGLPDNDIVDLGEDKTGRIWVGGFNGSIAYIKDEKVFNALNTPELKQVQGQGYVRFTGFGEKLLITRSLLGRYFEVDENGNLKQIPFNAGEYITVGRNLVSANAHIYNKLGLYNERYRKTDSLVLDPGQANYNKVYNTIALGENSFGLLTSDAQLYKYTIIKDKIVFSGSSATGLPIRRLYHYHGSFWADCGDKTIRLLGNGQKADVPLKHYIVNAPLNNFFVDRESNYWICTPGNGVYMMPNNGFGYYKGSATIYNDNVLKMTAAGNSIYLGYNNDVVQELSQPGNIFKLPSTGNVRIDKITAMLANTKYIAAGRYSNLVTINRQTKDIYVSGLRNVKCLDSIDGNKILAGTSGRCFIVELPDKIIDTVFKGRVSAVKVVKADSFLVGSNNGLYKSYKSKGGWVREAINIDPMLNGVNVSCIAILKDKLLIGTVEKGILLTDGKRVLQIAIEPDGKNYNCKKMVADHNGVIWVATYSGVYRVEIANGKLDYKVQRISKQTGLLSDFVSDIVVIGDSIYASSSSGISVFSTSVAKPFANAPSIIINSIVTNDSFYSASAELTLEYTANNIRISYSGLDFKSAGNVQFKYRLLGLSEKWQYTFNNDVQYESLPSGSYRFEIMAGNSEGNWSKVPAVFSFNINPPWWRRPIVVVLFLLAMALSIAYIVRKRLANRHHKEIEALSLKRQLLETELKALRAQINPHFLFNALNVLQYFISSKEYGRADEYLAALANVLRDTLEISGRTSVTVTEEVEFIENYLELERMRLDIDFSYQIECSPKPEIFRVEIPAMVLQPHIENALKHGLKHKKTGERELVVRFILEDNIVMCEVEDNGIGRNAAAKLKAGSAGVRSSKGIMLSESKLNVFEQLTGYKTTSEIMNMLVPGTQIICGTLVRITIKI